MAQPADSTQAQLVALQRLEHMLGIVDRIRATVHQMLDDQLPGKTNPASSNRVAMLPYATAITNDLNALGREGADIQTFIVAPPPPSAPLLNQTTDTPALQQLSSRLRSQTKQDHVAALAKRASALLSDQVETQFAGLNSRKKARSGISEQALNELIQMKPSSKLSITKVLQPVTDKLLALLLEGEEMKFYLMLQQITSADTAEDSPKAYKFISVSVLGKSELLLLGESSSLRVFQLISDSCALALQHFCADNYGDAALLKLVHWCEYYAAHSLFQTTCAHCEKILAEDPRCGSVPPTVRTFDTGIAMHAVCLQRTASATSGSLVPYYQ